MYVKGIKNINDSAEADSPVPISPGQGSASPLSIDKMKSDYKADRYQRVQQRAFALFQDLNENLLNIDDLYKNQMELHEQDFLAAYRG